MAKCRCRTPTKVLSSVWINNPNTAVYVLYTGDSEKDASPSSRGAILYDPDSADDIDDDDPDEDLDI